MPRRVRISRTLSSSLVILAIVALCLPPPARGQASARTGSFSLRPGVVVDLERSVVYAMSASSGIDALDIASGRVLWHTSQTARPLQTSGEILIVQAEKEQNRAGKSQNGFQIVLLDARDGRKRLAVDVNLPDGQWAAMDDGPGAALRTSATVEQGDVIVSWSTETRDVGGMAPSRQSSRSTDDTRLLNNQRSDGGTVRINLQSGRLQPVSPGTAAVQLATRADVSEQGRLANLPGDQYVSADNRHVLVSERIGDDSVWDKYRWSIHSLATGERLGEITNLFPRAAFFISGHTLVYQSQPYSWRPANGRLNREPLKLRVVDLRNGSEIWTTAVRDTAYRGPFPP